MANAAQQLQEAYQKIENGNLQEARQLLEEIRPQNENNPDFWWVYAHALEDESEGRNALTRVRQLAPNYPGLELVEEQAGIHVAQPQGQSLQRPGSPQAEDLFDNFDDDFSESETVIDGTEEGRNNKLLMGIGGLVILIVIILGIVIISGMLSGGGTAQPTEVVAQNTVQIINTPAEAATATEEPATIEPTEVVVTDPFAALYGDLAAFGVPDDGISTEATSLGNSIVVETCANPGPTANNNIIGVMNVFAAANLDISEDVETITFNIMNCDTNTLTLALGLDRDTFLSYLAGDISQAELLQAMQRIA